MEIRKAIEEHQALQRQKIQDSFEKGIYKDNAENKHKHRVGQHYGGKKVEDSPPTGYGYHIKNPTFSYNVGWLSDSKVKYGGWSVRNASDYDKKEFGAHFSIASPHQEEYKKVEGKYVQNVLFHSMPAKIENGWVKVLAFSSKWKVLKKIDALSFGNLDYKDGGVMYQDKDAPSIPDHIYEEQEKLKNALEGNVKPISKKKAHVGKKPIKFMDGNSYLQTGINDFELLEGDDKAKSVLADAKEMENTHRPEFAKNLKVFAKMFPHDIIAGRVKTIKSAIEKVVRKPKYKTPKNLQDFTGFRVVSETVEEVFANVKAFKSKYNVIDEDNYINQPLGDYRSYHLIGEKNGVTFEIQFRTKNQNKFADWAHNIYKPLNQKQKSAIEVSGDEINYYSHQISEYFFAKDNGKEANKPPCTVVIKITFGCL